MLPLLAPTPTTSEDDFLLFTRRLSRAHKKGSLKIPRHYWEIKKPLWSLNYREKKDPSGVPNLAHMFKKWHWEASHEAARWHWSKKIHKGERGSLVHRRVQVDAGGTQTTEHKSPRGSQSATLALVTASNTNTVTLQLLMKSYCGRRVEG